MQHGALASFTAGRAQPRAVRSGRSCSRDDRREFPNRCRAGGELGARNTGANGTWERRQATAGAAEFRGRSLHQADRPARRGGAWRSREQTSRRAGHRPIRFPSKRSWEPEQTEGPNPSSRPDRGTGDARGAGPAPRSPRANRPIPFGASRRGSSRRANCGRRSGRSRRRRHRRSGPTTATPRPGALRERLANIESGWRRSSTSAAEGRRETWSKGTWLRHEVGGGSHSSERSARRPKASVPRRATITSGKCRNRQATVRLVPLQRETAQRVATSVATVAVRLDRNRESTSRETGSPLT